jgi:urease accessory protein
MSTSCTMLRTAAALGAILLPTAAWAHPGHDATLGFGAGFVHPATGLDHVLAMIAVGLFAANLGGRALWAVPLSFVSVMAVGGALGAGGIAVPYVEAGIAISVIVLGLAVALRWKAPVAGAMALVGLFAIFHGHAHGAEMPVDAVGFEYGLGFILATALLHGAGIVAAHLAGSGAAVLVRLGGAGVTAAGLVLLAS